MNFWSRLKATRFARWVLLYLVLAWGFFKILKEIGETFGVQEAYFRATFVVLVIGFICVLSWAWARVGHEVVLIAGEGRLARLIRMIRQPRFLKASAVLVAAFGAGGVYRVVHDERPPLDRLRGEGVVPRVAVVAFTARDESLQEQREDLAWLLAGDLDGITGITTIDPGDITAHRVDADSLGAHFLVRGRASVAGEEIALEADVVDALEGESVGTARAQGPLSERIALIDSLAAGVLEVLGAGAEAASVSLQRYGTRDPEALLAFLRAESAHRRLELDRAIEDYQVAIDEDPEYALAHFRLGVASNWGTDQDIGDPFGRAIRFLDRMPEDRRALARAMIAIDFGSLIGIDDLQNRVRARPGDAEALYLLGYAVWNFGPHALLPIGAVDSATAAATALDPRFAPAWLVRVYASFEDRPDSARTGALIDSLAMAAPGSRRVTIARLAHEIAFGIEATRREGLAQLPSLTTDELWDLGPYLAFARTGEEEEAVLRELMRRGSDVSSLLAYNHLYRGEVAAALAALDGDDVTAASRAGLVYNAHLAGYPVPDSVLSAVLRPSSPPGSPVEDFFRGAFAAEETRWEDVTATLNRLRQQVQTFEDDSDVAGSRLFSSAARALDGYAIWNSEGREDVVYELEKDRASATAWGNAAASINGAIRMWVGHAWMDLGRPADAARYYDTFWADPMAALLAARAHAAAGHDERARAAYERVLAGWTSPDAELESLVVEARDAAGGSRSERGGGPRAAATCSSCPRLSSRS